MGPPHGNSYIRQQSYGQVQVQPPPVITAYRGVHGHGGYRDVAPSYDGDEEGDEYEAGADQPEENDEAQEEEPGPEESYEEPPYARGGQIHGDEYGYEDRQGPGGYGAYNDEGYQAGGPVADDEGDQGPEGYDAPYDDEAVDESRGYPSGENRHWYHLSRH